MNEHHNLYFFCLANQNAKPTKAAFNENDLSNDSIDVD
jgi:hypothetical protein